MITEPMSKPCPACESLNWHQIGSTFCLFELRAKGPALADMIATLRASLAKAQAERDEARETANSHRHHYTVAYDRLGAAVAERDALQAEVERLRAEVALVQSGSNFERARADAAWRAGAEAMREAAAKWVDQRGPVSGWCGYTVNISHAIRSLPPPRAADEET